MSKKDYVMFARMIRSQKNKIHNDVLQPDKELSIRDQQIFSAGALASVESLENELIQIFKNDNPSFAVDKFIKACEIEEK